MDGNVTACSMFHSDSSETVAYNNPLFPACIRYSFLSSYPDYSCISHWHKDLEFILVKKGAMTYNVNGVLIRLPEGSGILVNSRQLHYGFSLGHEECEFICILLSPELLQGNGWFYQNYVASITENPAFPYLYLGGEGFTSMILEKLEGIYAAYCMDASDFLPYFYIMEGFTAILRILHEHLDKKGQARAEEPLELSTLRCMMAYIEENYTEHLSLAGIALSGACCKSKCSLLFKKYLKETPMVYATKLRLRKSLPALLGSDKKISAIAYESGFGGASYYCEVFKKYYGMPPLMYKKSHAGLTPAAVREYRG